MAKIKFMIVYCLNQSFQSLCILQFTSTKTQVVTRVLLPATLPGVMDALRVTMGWAWTFLVVAELVAASSGLGYMILQAMRGLHPEAIFMGIFVIGFLGLAVRRRTSRYRE